MMQFDKNLLHKLFIQGIILVSYEISWIFVTICCKCLLSIVLDFYIKCTTNVVNICSNLLYETFDTNCIDVFYNIIVNKCGKNLWYKIFIKHDIDFYVKVDLK